MTSSNPKSLDTSVVIRLLVGVPENQFEAAMDFLAKQKLAGVCVQVEDMVLAEAYFALQSFYGMPKSAALEKAAKKLPGTLLLPC